MSSVEPSSTTISSFSNGERRNALDQLGKRPRFVVGRDEKTDLHAALFDPVRLQPANERRRDLTDCVREEAVSRRRWGCARQARSRDLQKPRQQ